MFRRQIGIILAVVSLASSPAAGQTPQAGSPPSTPPPEQDHSAHNMGDMQMGGAGWHFMQDGAFNTGVNHQGGPRGGTEPVGTNWYMGMWRRQMDTRRLTLAAMFSGEPLTTGKDGYREIFQVGEVLDGEPLVDRQHPHDLFMQLSASWKTSIGERGALTLSAAPAGAPALGPVAFMHRPSAAAILAAPLAHHVFDSTHISYGVATVAATIGPVTLEGSAFNGREPDDERWDFDFGRMDSVSGRIWLRATPTWTLQASAGRLVEPESLEEGNAKRRTISAAWWKPAATGFGAATIGYGNNVGHGLTRHAVFGESGRQRGRTTVSGRVEAVQLETNALLGVEDHEHPRADWVGALTIGLQHDLFRLPQTWGGVGANLTLHASPDVLAESHGKRPMSFQVYFQIRPPTSAMGRMWNNVMGL